MINLYIVNETEYPRHVGDVWLTTEAYANGETMPDGWEPSALPEGWEVVQKTPMPDADNEFYYVEGFPEKVNGVWTQTWVKLSIDNLVRVPRERARS